jgi:SNF2 family DNA or RNA helicase
MPKLVRPFKGFHYHAHQKAAIRWMMEREATDAMYCRGGILADEMGLGKTWMTIGLLLNAPVADSLLLVPPVLQPQWCEALLQCGIPHTVLGPPAVKGGGGIWTAVDGRVTGIHVTVATYDRAFNNLELVSAREYDRVICDEGHVFRNGKSSRKFVGLSGIPATTRWILSGTPVQNRKQDFRNLVTFLGMHSSFRDAKGGAKAHPCEGKGGLPVEERLKVADDLLSDALLLRRTVSDVRSVVTDMPAAKPTHVLHPVKMPEGGEEAKVFDALIGRFEHAIEVGARGTIVLELYLRIRQFLAHPAIYVDSMKRKYKAEYHRAGWTSTASKADAFDAFLGSAPAEPTIVFGTFREELDIAVATLERRGYKTWLIRGGMSEARRGAVTAESRAAAAAGEQVAIVIQIVAGGAGLNLQHCSRVMFLSSHWNPAVVDQAIARAYRMGQTKPVTVHHLLLADDAEKNLDRYMAGLHGVKRSAALEIHPLLFCDTAIDSGTVLTAIDDAAAEGRGPGVDETLDAFM